MAAEILSKTSDFILACDDGDIPACKFLMLSTCTVLNNIEGTVGDRVAIPGNVKIAVDVIHGIRKLKDLNLEELEKCAKSFDFLGCTVMRDSLTRYLWNALQAEESLDAWFRTAQRFVDSPKSNHQFVNGFAKKTNKFSDVLKLFESVDISRDSARIFMINFDKFHVLQIFCALLDAFPRDKLTEEIALDLLSCNIHNRFHPEEFAIALKRVTRVFPNGSPVLNAYIGANQLYDSAPVPQRLLATVLSYTGPRASVLVKIYDHFRGSKTLNINNWFRFELDTLNGRLGGQFNLTKLHRDAPVDFGDTCKLRITTMCTKEVQTNDLLEDDLIIRESWATHGGLNQFYWMPFDPIVPDHVRESLRDNRLRYVRVDLFYSRVLP